ncbi:MAG: hypothetical protein QHH07_09225 [Sedimentisphaerales bacterium]|nr:hypothetical protein [Sedimentisphaerales bacterium]
MTDQLDSRLYRLMQLARLDGPPGLDAVGPVMARIAALKRDMMASERQLMWVAGLATVAAAIGAVVAMPYWQASDTFAEVIEAIQWVMQ